MTSLQELLSEAIALIDESDEYPIDAINKLQAVINIVKSYLENPEDYTQALHESHIQALNAAIEAFEDSRIEEKPKEELPDTGMTVWFNPAAAFIVLGAATIAYSKRKED